MRPGPLGKAVGWPPGTCGLRAILAPVAAGGLLPPVVGLLPPVAGLLPPMAGVARFIRTDALATARAVLVCLRCLMAAGIVWLRLRNIVKGLLQDLSNRWLRFCGYVFRNERK